MAPELNLAIFGLGGPELLLILAIVVLLFGAKRIPELARGLGEGIRSFKSGMKEDDQAGSDHDKKLSEGNEK